MPSLPLPFMLPARLVAQALDDLHAIAEAARRLPRIEAALTEQFAVLNEQADRLIEQGDRLIDQGDRLIDQGERLHERGEQVLSQTELVIASAKEVAERGAEVAAALPHLQQLATSAEPLQGTIERFGRFVDRLPGAARRPEKDA